MATCLQCREDFKWSRRGNPPMCCYTCSPFEGKRAKGPDILEGDVPANIYCLKCNLTIPKEGYYRYRNNAPHQWCKLCLRKKAVVSQHRFKLECIEYKGGKCGDCNQIPHPAAMSFHHLDPSVKDFQLSNARTKILTESVKQELDKCVLLCLNCHAIRHAEQWDY